MGDMGAAIDEALRWAESHPLEVKDIVHQSTQFAKHFLDNRALDCYFLQVLRKVAALAGGPLHLPDDAVIPHWDMFDN